MNNLGGASLSGAGFYAPERELKNAYFDQLLGEDVSTWLEKNVEIFARRWCTKDQSTADLCYHAAQDAMKDAGRQPEDLDLIIVATDTPEYVSPSTAAVLQDRLGALSAGTFDVNTACAGFVTALDIAAKYIISDPQYQHVLVIGAYAMSKYLNIEDKKTVTLFADGAGAVVLSASKEQNYVPGELITMGQYADWMGIYSGRSHIPVTKEALAKHQHQLQFVKKFPKELNPKMWSQMIKDLCKKMAVEIEDIDHFFLTQININAIRETLDILGQPEEKATTIMHDYGYTGSACIPMAFAIAKKSGKVKSGQLCVFVGSGGGLAFASAALKT